MIAFMALSRRNSLTRLLDAISQLSHADLPVKYQFVCHSRRSWRLLAARPILTVIIVTGTEYTWMEVLHHVILVLC